MLFSRIDLYKKELDKYRPFHEEHSLKSIQNYYRIGLTWTSNALEGSSLTESKTKIILEDGISIGGKPLREIYETVDHAKAYDFIFSLITNRTLSETDIKHLHELFYKNIDSENAGQYRSQQVIVSGSSHPVCEPLRIEAEMQAFVLWMEENREKYHPVEFAALAHKKFVFIHPFADGNGRIARLLMNASLLQDGYQIAIIPLILRADYIQKLERTHTDDRPFIEFTGQRVFEAEKEMLRLLNIPFPHEKIM